MLDIGMVMIYMEDKLVLECKNLGKIVRKKEILRDINLKLYEKDILGFVGPNGAGKTTTIKTILGLQKMSSGMVKINGYDINKDFKEAISGVGAIVENPDLYNNLTGLDNLKISAKIYGIDNKRILEVIDMVGLSKRINDKVFRYSLGMKQRLGIAQAIIHKPKLLILDEPTNGLDPEGIKELRELLMVLSKKEKMAILISSHNLKELESFCNKVCILQQGKIRSYTNIDKIFCRRRKYIFELDRVNVGDFLFGYRVIDKKHIEISTDKKNIPYIIRKLVNNDIRIYSVLEERISLEEAYLQKIGGNIIE